MGKRDIQLINRKGKFSAFEIEIIDDESDDVIATRYEIRKQSEVLAEFSNEWEALRQLEEQEDLEIQKP